MDPDQTLPPDAPPTIPAPRPDDEETVRAYAQAIAVELDKDEAIYRRHRELVLFAPDFDGFASEELDEP
jgi:hypothetical protein